MKPALVIVLLTLPFAALPAPAGAQAQAWSSSPGASLVYDGNGDPGGYGQDRRRPYDFNGQADVPGDHRCDAYWDRGRTDCDARWRDQRPRWRRTVYRSGRYESSGGWRAGATVYPGAWGRPDVVYSRRDGRYGAYGNPRDADRARWCSDRYRSYDPDTGYYLAYSGQSVFCG